MTRRLLGLVAIGVMGIGASAQIAPGGAEGDPPCRADAELNPSRAVVGQQVLWRVRISTGLSVQEISWVAPPRFPNVRSERLPGRADSVVGDRAGGTVRIREEHRALFPERPGDLEILSAGLRCTLSSGDVFHTDVPAAVLRVTSPPDAGRPADFSGVIGPLIVKTHVEPSRITLGESVRLIVSLRGGGNLWDVQDPFAGFESPAAEWFATRPVLKLLPGTRLGVQRLFEYDLVPHRAGTLNIPALQIPYYDPVGRAYEAASAARIRVAVEPRSPVSPALPPSQPLAEPSIEAVDGGWIGLALLGSVTVAAATAAISLRRRASGSAARDEIDAARAAHATGDRDAEAAALARALRAALRPHLAADAARASEKLARAGPEARVAAALQALAAVERARFDPSALLPHPTEVERTIGKL